MPSTELSGPAGGVATPRCWTRVDAAWLVGVAGIALSLRLAAVLEWVRHPLGQLPWVDEGAYWTRGAEIAGGAWLPPGPFYQDPLFPYLLAALMKGVGTRIAPLRIALAGIGGATAAVVFCAGRRGLGRREGALAGLIVAFYGPSIFTDGLLEKEGLAALLAAVTLLLCARDVDRCGGLLTAAGIGWTWGLVALLRGNALIVGPLAAAWAWWPGTRRGWARGGAVLAGFALALSPSFAINRAVGERGDWIVTTWQGGANFYIGNGPGATGTYRAPDFVEANPAREAADFASEARRRSGRTLSPGGVSRYWLRAGLDHWRGAPGESARLLAHKFALLLHDFEIPDNQDLAFVREVAAPALAAGFLSWGWLLPCAMLGMARAPWSRFQGMVAISTGAGLLTTAVFFVVGRYRIPWVPGMALLAGAGVVDLSDRIRRREVWGAGGRVALVLAPALVLAWRPIADPVPDRWGHAELTLAMAELGAGRLEAAIDALDDARAFSAAAAGRVAAVLANPTVHDRLAAIVTLRLEQARRGAELPDARRARWLRQFPERRARARDLLESALARAPDDRVAIREWGAWWLGEPDDPRARARAAAEFARAAAPPGGDRDAALLLALLSRVPKALPAVAVGERAPTRLRLARRALRVRD